MKALRHTSIQIRVVSTKNNSDGPPKLLKLENCLRAGSYGWQQILVQAKEGGTRARCGIKLLIQQRHKLISNLGISEESTDLPPVHAAENKVVEHRLDGPGEAPDERRREKEDRFWRSERGHRAVIGIKQNKSCHLLGGRERQIIGRRREGAL